MKCHICGKTAHKAGSNKGFYQLKTEYLGVLNLPPDFVTKNHRVCFRHFKHDDFYFVGEQVRLKIGKYYSKKSFEWELSYKKDNPSHFYCMNRNNRSENVKNTMFDWTNIAGCGSP